ncbi:MAG: outer membrane beta-barrel protein [Bacteriovoracaceae bacterium]
MSGKSLHYETDTDDVTQFEYGSSHYALLIGATFGKSDQWVVGQSFVNWSRTEKDEDSAADGEIALLELGPRFQYFFNTARTIYLAFTYNFYAKGTRNVAGEEYDISGTGMLAAFGAQFKISKKFYIGFSLNYHSVGISEESQDSTKSDVSNSYTMIYPAVEMSFRFKKRAKKLAPFIKKSVY